MHLSVDAEHCERSGECVALVPRVFSFAADGRTVVADGPVPAELEDKVRAAVDFCPRLALTVTD
jgi:ferredoxin